MRAEAWAGCWEGREAGQASGQGLLGAEGIPSVTLYLFEMEKNTREVCVCAFAMATRPVSIGFGSPAWVWVRGSQGRG